ncbi:hypothetical protein CB1_001095017 [Camelus ferus]|nr:hypothetical protein CB1_001095017 [Camelus ferus]
MKCHLLRCQEHRVTPDSAFSPSLLYELPIERTVLTALHLPPLVSLKVFQNLRGDASEEALRVIPPVSQAAVVQGKQPWSLELAVAFSPTDCITLEVPEEHFWTER